MVGHQAQFPSLRGGVFAGRRQDLGVLLHRRSHEGAVMSALRTGALVLAYASVLLLAPLAAVEAESEARSQTAANDGSHDFDFDFGTWKTHSRRLMHPLTGSQDWVEMDGVTVVSKIWGGRANLAEYRAEGHAGVVELLALRVYNPKSHQWSINFATPRVGTLGEVPGVGEFRNGRADFYDLEAINGRAVLVRFSIWGVSADEARSEQAFSADGGKTWEVNWITRYTRASPS